VKGFPNPTGRSPTAYRAPVTTSPPRRGALLGLIFAVTATGIMGNSLVAPLIPDILDDLGVGDGGAGLIVAAVSLPGIVMAPLIGLLADRLGRRTVLVPCLVMFGLCGLAVAMAPNFLTVLAARFGQGIGAAGLINLSVVLIGDHWEGEQRTRLIGRNSAMLTVGLAVFPLLSGVVAELANWRVALVPYGLALVTAGAAWRILDGGRSAVPVTVGEQMRGLGDAIRRPAIVAVLVSGLVTFALIFGVFLTALPLHLEREFSVGAAGRGLFLSIPAVTASLVAFNLQRITSRIGRRVALIGAATLFVVAFSMIGVAPVLVLIALGAALYGLGEGVLIPTLQDIAVTEAPPAQRGAVVAVWVGAARLGQTLGPVMAALLLSATDTSVALLAGAGLAGVLLVLLALGPLGRRPRLATP
jgi:MFS transporter, ACDE family, multidrug resistance protein